MKKENIFIFKNNEVLPNLENKKYNLKKIHFKKGTIPEFKIVITSFTFGDKSLFTPIVFFRLPNFVSLNKENTIGELNKILDLTNSNGAETLVLGVNNETDLEYDFTIEYEFL